MRTALIWLNSVCIVADSYGMAYWHEPRWTALLAFNAVALVLVLTTQSES
jgi:hypothetical protein